MRGLKQFQSFAKGKLYKSLSENRCVIYTRVSTKEQAENNMSLDTQKKACEQYAKKHGYTIMAYFGGTYESAKTDERKEFTNMLEFVNKCREKISYIIVQSLDRFSRSGGNAIYISEQLKHQGISVLSVFQPIDTSTPSGQLQQNIQFIFSEYDNQLRKDKSIAGMRNKLEQGIWCRKPPLGYDIISVNGKRSIVVNATGELLRKAFFWKLFEQLSNTEVQQRLKTLGLNISRQKVSTLFTNPFYCGVITTKTLEGKVVDGKHEKLVPKDLFITVNDFQKSKRKSTKYNFNNPDIPLKDVLFCHACGAKMSGYLVRDKNLYYYKCATIGCKSNKSAVQLHAMFIELLTRIKFDEEKPLFKREFVANFVQIEKSIRGKKRQYNEALALVSDKIDAFEELYILKEIDNSTFNKHIQRLQKRKEEIEKGIHEVKPITLEQDTINNQADNLVNSLAQIWLNGNLIRRRLLHSLVFPEGLFYNKRTNQLVQKSVGSGLIIAE